MTRFDARGPTAERTSALPAQAEPSITRFVLCGGPHAGKRTLLAHLQGLGPVAGTQGLPPAAAAAGATGAGFGTATRAYAGIEPPWLARPPAAAADLAIFAIDACTGADTQTRRQTYLVALAGVRHVVAAVTKMDLAGYAQDVFERVAADFAAFAARVGVTGVTCVPVSAAAGDNLSLSSSRMPWYRGPALAAALDAVPADASGSRTRPFRLPVERVEPASAGARAVGTIASGGLRRGQRIRVQPRGQETTVVRIAAAGGDLEHAVADLQVTLAFSDTIEVARGDVITAAGAPAPVANRFEATVVWLSDQPLLRGRDYVMQTATGEVIATVAPLKHKVNVDTLEKVAANQLGRDEIGEVALELDQPIAFDPYCDNTRTGGFVLLDRIGHDQVGIGMLRFALRRADNVHWQAVEVDKRARQALNGHRSGVVWMTGLSGAGKSTLANMLEKRLHARGLRTYLLDGDNVRHGLNKDLGFTAADRVENIRRIAEVAKLMVDAGIIVITAFISPFRTERRMARELMGPGEFVEVFVDTPLATAERRDPKGLYGKARRGELKNFTGIDSPYEAPEAPEVRVDTVASSVEQATQQIYDALIRLGLIERE